MAARRLNEASVLKGDAAHMLQALLEQRADVREALGDATMAADDRQRAAKMRTMTSESVK